MPVLRRHPIFALSARRIAPACATVLLLFATAVAAQTRPGAAAPGRAAPAAPAAAEQRVQPLPAGALKDDKQRTRSASLPAKGLFFGEQLSASARERLTELIIEAAGLQVEVALVVPTGPWQIDGSGASERDLTPARLQALRRFLTDRGVDPKRIFVETRIDEKAAEPRLDVQLVGGPEGN
jgi:OOP family OmpA-OmpF porin